MTNNTLITNLQTATAFPHPVRYFKLIETHISWIILTGEYAYKIKKPVDFVFLNYSTLEKRHYYAQEEVRINKLLAPDIYLDVVAINGTPEKPHINGTGPILDYAVKMREFPQVKLLSELLLAQQLTTEIIDQLALVIANFHLQTPVADANSRFGTPEQVHAPVVQNFDQIAPLLTDPIQLERLARLRTWAEKQFSERKQLLQERKQKGFIRDCHGDLHLGNIILHQQKPVLFDRIEFNEDFRWTDVMADVGFLAMDLEDNFQIFLARQFVNAYLSHTGDYAGLGLLTYYKAYRAMVRAKVTLFRLHQPGLSTLEKHATQQKYDNLINLAEQFARQTLPQLIITHGTSGSGKSFAARLLVDHFNAIHVSSDIERKRMFDLTQQAKTYSPVNQGIYDPQITEKVYAHLAELARLVIQAGFTVVVDATFLKRQHRDSFKILAEELKVPFTILHCKAPEHIQKQWIQERLQKGDPSEANLDVLTMQQNNHEPLAKEELSHSITTDLSQFKPEEIIQHLSKNRVQL